MAQDKMFEEALRHIHQGERGRARDLLTRLLRANKSNVDYWIWMSSVVDSPTERIYCLESALRLDPENVAAKRGLVILGARPAGDDVVPVPPIKRKWWAELEVQAEPPKSFIGKLWANPILRLVSIIVIALLTIGLISLGIFGIRRQEQMTIVRLTITPRPTRTFTITVPPTATNTRVVRSPTPTFIGPTPLWMFLKETYTPTPLYVNTPHPVIEAYRAALRAFERNDYQNMLAFMQQASRDDPSSPDFFYYIGEVYRLTQDYEEAIAAYERSLEVNPNFAPAYLGLARARSAQNPGSDISQDLEGAISLDPNLAEAYLERAAYSLSQDQNEAALEDLIRVEELLPQSPLLYALRAQIYLNMGENAAALEDARKAYEMDQTLLLTHLVLAHAYLVNQNPTQALKYIEIYNRYIDDNPQAWWITGLTNYMIGTEQSLEKNLRAAILAFDQAQELAEDFPGISHYRGLAYLKLGEVQSAVNDLVAAVRQEPDSFEINRDLGIALWQSTRLDDAYRQFTALEKLAQDDLQLAEVLYWRAQVLEEAQNVKAALADWEALLALPAELIPGDWLALAQERILILNPPTATVTPTPTRTGTVTNTPRPTATPTPSPSPTELPFRTPTVAPTRTPTRLPSRTPTQTRMPTRTPTP